jgi:hypothetical protein
MMPDNDYYGHRTAMARYCGLKQLSPAVFGSIRHGWQPDLGQIGDRTLTAAPIFVWNEREAAQAAERAIPNVVPIGAPFLYGVAAMAAGAGPPAGTGTIVFPLHSDGFTEARQDRPHLIGAVEAAEPGPYAVSIYYQDLARPEVVEPFVQAGWRVVSFGSRDDPMFMPRLILELQAHQVVVSDLVCSAIWYGAHLGRRVRVMGPPPSFSDDRPLIGELRDRWPDLYRDGIEGPAAVELAAVELGVPCMRPPDELAELLGWRSWHRYAARLGRLAVDARHGNELRRGQPISRAMRRAAGR